MVTQVKDLEPVSRQRWCNDVKGYVKTVVLQVGSTRNSTFKHLVREFC